MMTIIAEVIAGSHLQGLATPESDLDTRYVWQSDLGDLLAPWDAPAPPIPDADDVQGWELTPFVKMLTRGNPTALEVLNSDLGEVLDHPTWVRLRSIQRSLGTPEAIAKAHLGYASSQGRLAETSESRRGSKARVAMLRVLIQGAVLLTTGVFQPRVTERREMLVALRERENTPELIAEWHAATIIEQQRLETAAENPHPSLAQDRATVARFLADAYCEAR